MWAWFMRTFSQPSTWAGIGAIAVTASQAFPALAPVAHPLAIVSGGLGVALNEKAAQ